LVHKRFERTMDEPLNGRKYRTHCVSTKHFISLNGVSSLLMIQTHPSTSPHLISSAPSIFRSYLRQPRTHSPPSHTTLTTVLPTTRTTQPDTMIQDIPPTYTRFPASSTFQTSPQPSPPNPETPPAPYRSPLKGHPGRPLPRPWLLE